MKVLTFIIPAYNSERFLNKCVDSMLVTDILDRLEIIVVNDGSTDGTFQIAQKYCEKYPGTVRLISQENKGHGGALNTGIAAAAGKYVKVIDADDWVVSKNLPEFISQLESCESNVVLTHFHTVDISNGEVRKWESFPEQFGKTYTMEEIMENERDFYRVFALHGITYKTAFYKEFGIRLSEHVFYEDFEYATFPCCRAKSITPLDLYVYEYRIGDVNQSVADETKLKRIGHVEIVLNRMLEENKYTEDIPAGGRAYIAMKSSELLLSYFTTVLLVEPNKNKGRIQADRMFEHFWKEFPQAVGLVERKYHVFYVLSRVHMSKKMWDRIMRSKLYRKLRGEREFS